MKIVNWTDTGGFRHRAIVHDNQTEHDAPNGIPLDPPDLDRMDWEGVRRELHNALLDHGILDWMDYQQHNNIVNIITGAVKRGLVTLYREIPEDSK